MMAIIIPKANPHPKRRPEKQPRFSLDISFSAGLISD
jgi:hypothetical protein